MIKKKCKHTDKVTLYDHHVCKWCNAVKTDSGWGIAKNRWFKSIEVARHYEETGKLPE